MERVLPFLSTKAKLSPNYRSITSNRHKLDTTSEIGRASNATLGYEKLYVLGLKQRFDRRDAITLAASLTGFDVEFWESIRGEDIVEKFLPPGMDTLLPGRIGSWRGHMDIIRSIVENKISSVFILEDDADWDIRLPFQMRDLAKGIRQLSGVSPTEKQHSPYGDDWDVIWPGHCGDEMPKHEDQLYIIEHDETVAPKEHQTWLKGLAEYPEGTRLIQRAGAPICSFGYGVSYRGAQKLLMALAVKGMGALAFDNALATLCRDGFLDVQCYSVQPELIHHHRSAGSLSRDSDILGGDTGKFRPKAETDTIVLSARLNMEPLLTGSEEFIKQW
ncbi:glycosyltransferase family 25 protein [Oidiodendron maius Zn]|uniref:Glycosyltransferase family 25 protein n=1 Tax=Oidiodendron maius (strain Zn) TaxID=913774 RepID=A0A0C3HB11_OIDMZ|nr:glycosyltransferase family 25 protein [Oidiodendron maius Zn]